MAPATTIAQIPTAHPTLAHPTLAQTATDPRIPALGTVTQTAPTTTAHQAAMTTTLLPRTTRRPASSWRRSAVRSKTMDWLRRDNRSVLLLATTTTALETPTHMDPVRTTNMVLPITVTMITSYIDRSIL